MNETRKSEPFWWLPGRDAEKRFLWVPYCKGIARLPNSKKWVLNINEEAFLVDASKLCYIMFYGNVGAIPMPFLDELSSFRAVCVIMRRNARHPYVFLPAGDPSREDLLTAQILCRCNDRKAAHVARSLVKARLSYMQAAFPRLSGFAAQLAEAKTVGQVRAVEARLVSAYWKQWYAALGLRMTRRSRSPVNSALDAGSHFIAGILMRWIVFHRLSPHHAFLHETTGYPALVYDLMEPYRYLIEESAAAAWKELARDVRDEDPRLATVLSRRAIDILMLRLDEEAGSEHGMPAAHKQLLRGAVVSLARYCRGETRTFRIPLPGAIRGASRQERALCTAGG